MSDRPTPGPPLRLRFPSVAPGVREFLATEAGSAIFLLAATVIALVWANSPWSAAYEQLWSTSAGVHVGNLSLDLDLHHLVNDAAVAVFFCVVGVEINREVTRC